MIGFRPGSLIDAMAGGWSLAWPRPLSAFWIISPVCCSGRASPPQRKSPTSPAGWVPAVAGWSAERSQPVRRLLRSRTEPTSSHLNSTTSAELNDLGVYVPPGASIVPACLAALDEASGPVTGGQLLAAVVAGYETTVRLSECVGPSAELEIGWHTPAFHGAVGAAVSAGVLLGLDRDHIAQALTIAADIAGGGLMFARLGSDVKRMHAGRAAETGVFAALLARAGMESRLDVIEHPHWGYCRTMTASTDRYDLSEITDGLGSRFVSFARTGVKYYPVGAEIQGVIDNISQLKTEHDIVPDQISDVVVGTTRFFVQAAVHRVPDSISEIHFNIEYGTAMALLHDVRPVHQGPEVLQQWIEGYRNPEVRALCARVQHVEDLDPDAGNPYSVDSRVTISMRDGRLLKTASAYVAKAESSGTMKFAPMDRRKIKAKFQNMTQRAVSSELQAEISAGVLGIFDVRDAKRLWALIADRG